MAGEGTRQLKRAVNYAMENIRLLLVVPVAAVAVVSTGSRVHRLSHMFFERPRSYVGVRGTISVPASVLEVSSAPSLLAEGHCLVGQLMQHFDTVSVTFRALSGSEDCNRLLGSIVQLLQLLCLPDQAADQCWANSTMLLLFPAVVHGFPGLHAVNSTTALTPICAMKKAVLPFEQQ